MTNGSKDSTDNNIAEIEMPNKQDGDVPSQTNRVANVDDQSPTEMINNPGLAIQTQCEKCEKPNDSKAKYKAITCKFCEKWTCGKCTDMSQKQIELFDRGNLYFACNKCQDAVSQFADEMRSNCGLIRPATPKSNAVGDLDTPRVDQLVVLKNEIDQRFSDLEKLIKQTQGDIANSVSTSIETAVNSEVSKAMDNVVDNVSDKVGSNG